MNQHSPARKNILAIDDDSAVLGVVARLLRDRYEVRTAEDGRAALDLVALLRPDLVLLDVRFPGMDGLSILRELRRFDPDLKVLMLTGDMDIDTVRRAFAGGALGYLTKPFSPDEVDAMVDGALAGGGSCGRP